MTASRASCSAYTKQKEASCKTSASLNQTPEAWQKRAEYMRAYRAKRSADAKQEEASYTKQRRLLNLKKMLVSLKAVMKQYRTNSEASCIQDLIYIFHNIVSQCPIYICSCCDQLWYSHGVNSAHKLRKSNTSVDNTEWICISCGKYLIKNKVPPCAAVNRMKFPKKPSFFDLNELEYILLAPRLAFQKLMEAPRGKQFKNNGNIVNVPADVTNSVSLLPRLTNVNLKRKWQCKSSVLSLGYYGLRCLLWLPSLICVYKNCLCASKFLPLGINMWHSLFPYYLRGSVVYFIVPFLDLWLFCGRWFGSIDLSQLFGHVGSCNSSTSTSARLEYTSSFLKSIGKAQSKSTIPSYLWNRLEDLGICRHFRSGEVATALAIGLGILQLKPQDSCHLIMALLYPLLDRKFVKPSQFLRF